MDRGPWRRRARTASYVAVAVSLLGPAIASQAQAAPLPTSGRSITIFPVRDFIAMEGWETGKVLQVEVRRGGVLIATASGVVPDGEPDPKAPGQLLPAILEVNHPGGVCWERSTPDLLPGDEVVVFEQGDAASGPTAEGQSTINVTAEPGTALALDVDAVVNDFVVHGTAAAAGGGRLDLDLMEQRIVQPAFTGIPAVGRRDIRATFNGGLADGVGTSGNIAWDRDTDPAAGLTSWTATYRDLPAGVAALAEDSRGGQTRALAWHPPTDVNVDPRPGITIFEAGESGGPGPECLDVAPAAKNAVTATSPSVVNQAAVAAAGHLTVSGVSFDASSVDLSIDDAGQATTVPVTMNALTSASVGAGAWTAAIQMSDVASLRDGTLTISATFNTAGGPLAGPPRTILKDTVAPAAPSLSPDAGTYIGTQQVTATGGAGTVLRYATDPSAALINPTSGNAVNGQIAISSTQTLRVIAFDAAGNASPVKTAAYTINAPSQPLPTATTPTLTPAPAPAALAPAPAPAVVAPAPKPVAVVPAPKPRASSTVPGAPRIGVATGGKPGGKVTAKISWKAPVTNGGASIVRYKVSIRRVGSTKVVTRNVPGWARSLTVKGLVSNARYRFYVTAVNARGASLRSPLSSKVVAK